MSAAEILQALCCDCGTLRTITLGGPNNYVPPGFIGNYRFDAVFIEERKAAGTMPAGFQQYHRMLAILKCSTCKQRTRHALIHPADDEWRDAAEHDDHASNFLIPAEPESAPKDRQE